VFVFFSHFNPSLLAGSARSLPLHCIMWACQNVAPCLILFGYACQGRNTLAYRPEREWLWRQKFYNFFGRNLFLFDPFLLFKWKKNFLATFDLLQFFLLSRSLSLLSQPSLSLSLILSLSLCKMNYVQPVSFVSVNKSVVKNG